MSLGGKRRRRTTDQMTREQPHALKRRRLKPDVDGRQTDTGSCDDSNATVIDAKCRPSVAWTWPGALDDAEANGA